MGGVVLHYRRRNNNVGHRRGSGHERVTLALAGLYACRGVGGVALGAGCANHVADGGSAVARARRRAGLDGADWGERHGEGARRGGGLMSFLLLLETFKSFATLSFATPGNKKGFGL